jgi:Ca-activated chloride channel family protein
MSPSTSSGVTLGHPALLVLGLLVAAALVLGAVRLTRRRSAALAAAGIAVPGRAGVPLALWLSLGGVLLLAVAWAGPAAALPVGRSAGTVVLAVDVSNSMGATDVTPSRLVAAQQAADAFIDAQPDTVDIGVVGFDQGALTTSLPTADREASKAAVQHLRLSGGTSLSSAILGSLSAITGKTVAVGDDGALPDLGYWGSATIVLLSDGGDSTGTEDAATTAATLAQNAGVHLETVGVGTAAGANVEVDGFQLHTALDADKLTALARTTGGAYHPASDASQLNGIASAIDLRLTVAKQDVPLAGGITAAALALLAAGAVLTGLRTGRLV